MLKLLLFKVNCCHLLFFCILSHPWSNVSPSCFKGTASMHFVDKGGFDFVTDTISLLPLPGKLLTEIILSCLHAVVMVLPENS